MQILPHLFSVNLNIRTLFPKNRQVKGAKYILWKSLLSRVYPEALALVYGIQNTRNLCHHRKPKKQREQRCELAHNLCRVASEEDRQVNMSSNPTAVNTELSMIPVGGMMKPPTMRAILTPRFK